jgi:hypothetical protein
MVSFWLELTVSAKRAGFHGAEFSRLSTIRRGIPVALWHWCGDAMVAGGWGIKALFIAGDGAALAGDMQLLVCGPGGRAWSAFRIAPWVYLGRCMETNVPPGSNGDMRSMWVIILWT